VRFHPDARTLVRSVGSSGIGHRRAIGWESDVTTALSNWDIVSDAELARAAAAGDRGAFAMIYDRYADRLHDFCVGMVRDRDAAADCVQDVFCTAATQLAKLREPDRLRPWLYAIARNEALRCIRDRRREQVSDDLPEAASGEAGPETLAARTELADLIAQAAGGLSDRDRTVLELAYRHGLDGPELANALEVSPGTANRMVSRLRATIETSLGALLVARRAQHAAKRCDELATILAGWDGRFSVLMRKRISRHIESCPTCEDERRRLVNPVALLGGAPVFIPAPAWLKDQTLGDIKLTSAGGTLVATSATSSPDAVGSDDADYLDEDGRPRDARGLIPWIALVAAAAFLAAMLTIALFYHHDTAVSPTQLSKNAPAPTKPVAPPSAVPNSPPPPAAPPANTVAPEVITPPAETPAPVQPPEAPPPAPPAPPPAEPPPIVPPVAEPPVIAPPPVLVPPPVFTLPPLPPPPPLAPPTALPPAPPSAPPPRAPSAPPAQPSPPATQVPTRAPVTTVTPRPPR
jgi:RNA polymerase sigma factor (sigma-70 family)